MFSFVERFLNPKRSSFKIRRGLDLPIAGPPDQIVYPGTEVNRVALCTRDFVGLRPKPLVQEGDRVKLGEPLFCDRKHPEILFTAPAAGIVCSVVSGPRRVIQSFIIRLEGDAAKEFESFSSEDLQQLKAGTVREALLQSGLWTSLRSRPFGRIPPPESEPEAIFVRAVDTNPLAPDPSIIIQRYSSAFEDGLRAISRLTSGPLYLCQGPGKPYAKEPVDRLQIAHFQGRHPAGLVGTHIHFLHRVGAGHTVWYLDYQDAIGIGRFFRTGKLPVERIVALGGSALRHPRLVEARLGCSLTELLAEELEKKGCRVISGSVLSGRTAFGAEGFLGRYDSQISVIEEASSQERERWFGAKEPKFSFHSLVRPSRRNSFRATTSRHGPQTVMIPLGSFERVMPLDLLPTPLLRALAVEDAEQARALGCLELEEEDLALCSVLCPGKLKYGKLLRRVLQQLEKEV